MLEMTSRPEGHAVLQIEVPSDRAVWRLRSWQPDHVAGTQTVTIDGVALPMQVGAMLSGALRVLCIGPADWLLVCEKLGASDLLPSLRAQLHSQSVTMVDQSDGLSVLRLRGQAARDLISKGCGLDMHPRSFVQQQCARTRFANIAVVLACLDVQAFEVYVVRSYGSYLRSWLTDAAAEFEDPTT